MLVILGVSSEAPSSGPYAPSGWKPKGTPFILPQEFIPSALVRPAQAVYPVVEDREGVKRENLDFFGQTNVISQGSPNQYVPPNQYAPPGQYVPSPDPRNVFTSRREQSTDRPNFFFGRKPSPRSNIFPRREGVPPRPIFPREPEQQIPNTEDDFLKVQGLPNSDPNNFEDGLKVNVGSQGELTPEKAYGAPEESRYIAPENYKDQPENTYTSSENLKEESDNEEEVVSKGQYYILTDDNTLQKVSFETKQSDKDVQDNTFTAELKYQPVEPIADPVYAYNKKGQLVRILRKK